MPRVLTDSNVPTAAMNIMKSLIQPDMITPIPTQIHIIPHIAKSAIKPLILLMTTANHVSASAEESATKTMTIITPTLTPHPLAPKTAITFIRVQTAATATRKSTVQKQVTGAALQPAQKRRSVSVAVNNTAITPKDIQI